MMEQWIRSLLKRQSEPTVLTIAPTNMASGNPEPEHTASLLSLTSSSIAYSGNSPGQAVAPSSLSSDKPTDLSTSTQSVLPAQDYQSIAGHSLSNDTVAGIVVGAAIGLALITFLLTFLFMRRKQRARSRRRHHGPSEGVLVPRKSRNRPIVKKLSGASSPFENYLPQSAEDNTVKQRARTTLEQIGFHVETFYQSLPDVSIQNIDDQLAIFESPYLPTLLLTLLRQSKDKTPLIMHSLAYFVTLSISPINGTEQSLLPIEFVTLPSSVGCVKSNVSANAGKIQFCVTTGHFIAHSANADISKELSHALSKWRVLTVYLHSSSPDTAYRARVDEQIQNMATSFSNAFAPWRNRKYRSKDRVRNLFEILKQAADLGIWLFSQPSAYRFNWPTSTPRSTSEIIVLPGLVKETDEKGMRLKDPQVLVEPVMKRP